MEEYSSSLNSSHVPVNNPEEAHRYLANFRRCYRNRESQDNLALLEAELRRAYVRKELQAQLAEKETEEYIENVRKQQFLKTMKLEEELAFEEGQQRRSEIIKRSIDYRHDLEEQIMLKEYEKKISTEEAKSEREILAEVDRIKEEDKTLRTLQKKNELADIMQREILIMKEMKLIREHMEQEAEEQKRLDELKYLKEIEDREERMKSLQEKHTRERERLLLKVASILINLESEKREKKMMSDLLAEEIRYELLIGEEKERIRRKKVKEELVATLEEQINFKEECKIRFVERDVAFIEEIMKKIMEDEKMKRLTLEAKKRRQLKYKEELQCLIESRRRIREKEILKMVEEIEEEHQLEEMRKNRVTEERKKLLAQHVSKVAEFLKRDAFTHEEYKIVEEIMKKKENFDDGSGNK